VPDVGFDFLVELFGLSIQLRVVVMSIAYCIIFISIFQYFSKFFWIFLLFSIYFYKSYDLRIT
jgi:hypothetical protein